MTVGDRVVVGAPPRVAGLLLAAGSGRRYGQPKALVDTGAGPWVLTSLAVLQACDVLVVVVGAAADDVAAVLPRGVRVVVNPDHASGMGSSLRVGLTALSAAAGPRTRADPSAGLAAGEDPPFTACDAAVVHLVDLPGVRSGAVARLMAAAGSASASHRAVLRAAYGGVPGHPVVLGRDHWAGVIESASGDSGARNYFRGHPPGLVECGDLGCGQDVDLPPAR